MFRNHSSFAAVLSKLRRRLFPETAAGVTASPLSCLWAFLKPTAQPVVAGSADAAALVRVGSRRRRSQRFFLSGEPLEARIVPAAIVINDTEPNNSTPQQLPPGNELAITGTLLNSSDIQDSYILHVISGQTITLETTLIEAMGSIYCGISGEGVQVGDGQFPLDFLDTYRDKPLTMKAGKTTDIRIEIFDGSGPPLEGWKSFYGFTLKLSSDSKDIQAKTLEWDTAKKGVTISYKNTVKLDKSTKGALFWATGTTVDTIIDKSKPAYTFNLDKTVGTHTKFVADSQIKAAAQPAVYLLLVLDPPSDASADGVIKESDETNNVLAVKGSWAAVTEVKWNTKIGGLDVKYQVLGNRLDPQTKLVVYWSQDSTRLGEIVTITDFDKTKGKHGPINIDKTKLHDAATGTTHLLAVIDPDRLNYDAQAASERAIKDVTLTPDADVNFGSVSEKSIQAIKDSLRYAGQAVGNVTSAFRTTLEQAQAMINNYTFAQLRSLYGSNAAAMTGIQAAEDAAAANALARKVDPKVPKITKAQLIAAMKEAFDALPDKGAISKHMGDFSQLQAIDLSHSRMTNKKLFHEAITKNTKIGKVLDPYTTPKDKAFHVEIAQ